MVWLDMKLMDSCFSHIASGWVSFTCNNAIRTVINISRKFFMFDCNGCLYVAYVDAGGGTKLKVLNQALKRFDPFWFKFLILINPFQ